MHASTIILNIIFPPKHSGIDALFFIFYAVSCTFVLVLLRQFRDKAIVGSILLYLLGLTSIATRLMRLHFIPGVATLSKIAPLDYVVYFEHYLGAIAAGASLTTIISYVVYSHYMGKGFISKPDLFPKEVIQRIVPLAVIPYMLYCWGWEIYQANFLGKHTGNLHNHFQTWQIFWDMAGIITYVMLFKCIKAPIDIRATLKQCGKWYIEITAEGKASYYRLYIKLKENKSK